MNEPPFTNVENQSQESVPRAANMYDLYGYRFMSSVKIPEDLLEKLSYNAGHVMNHPFLNDAVKVQKISALFEATEKKAAELDAELRPLPGTYLPLKRELERLNEEMLLDLGARLRKDRLLKEQEPLYKCGGILAQLEYTSDENEIKLFKKHKTHINL